VFSASTVGTLLPTTSVNPYTGHVNTHAEVAAGLSGFVELCYFAPRSARHRICGVARALRREG
jgi:hypothetical protein